MWYTITLATGIVLLLISLHFLKESLSFLRTSNRATATVIELETVKDSDGDTYRAIFRYYTNSGQEFIYRQGSSSSPAIWDVGEEATIAYDPNDPYKARLVTFFSMFGATAVLMAIALPCIVFGLGYFLSQLVLK